VSVATPREVLDFWFKESPRDWWFRTNPEFDAEIRARFEETWRAARVGQLKTWTASRDGTLALILLLDQFPRNMFRGKPESFATDPLAREAAAHALARGYDLDATADERHFLYLPFMHSEHLNDQEICVRLIRERLGEDHSSYPYAVRHRDAIARFGRFPARNLALGRASTKDEETFLTKNPSGF
jgi:uncharacterized protein (DUF924 family)